MAEVIAKQLRRAEIGEVHLESVAGCELPRNPVPDNALARSVVENRHLDVLEEIVADTVVGVEVLDAEEQLRVIGRLMGRREGERTSFASACVKRKKRRYWNCVRLV